MAARANLAYAYRSARRFRDAIPQYERTLDDRIRVQGPDRQPCPAAPIWVLSLTGGGMALREEGWHVRGCQHQGMARPRRG